MIKSLYLLESFCVLWCTQNVEAAFLAGDIYQLSDV